METKIFASYLRVSTKKQGDSQLGLSSQRNMCMGFIESNNGTLGQEFVDVESGTHRDRKGLWDAIEYCNKHNCPLVVATLSRLARDVEFCFKVVNTGIEIHFVDMPQVNTLLLGVFAAVAQYERELTSERTKKALSELKKKGNKLGGRNEKFRMAMTAKKLSERSHASGRTKSKAKTMERDFVVFAKILRKVFPEATKGNGNDWAWKDINTAGENKSKVLALMQSYKELEPTLFASWDFGSNARRLQVRLASQISNMRKTFANCA